MKRPVLAVLIGYIIGIIWGCTFKISIVPFWLIFLLLFLIQKNKKYKTKRLLRIIFNINVIIVIAIFSILSNTIVIIQNNKYENLYNEIEEVEVIGKIISQSEETNYKQRYKIKVQYLNNDKKYKNTNLMLYVDKKEKILEYGDIVKIKGEYKKPEVSRNEGGYDQRKIYKLEKIYGSLYAKSQKVVKTKTDKGIFYIANKVKEKLIENAKAILPEDKANLLIGILLGETSKIPTDTLDMFKTSNLYHLLAVSGAHVGYLSAGVLILLEKIGIHKKKRKIACILFLIFFMILTSLTPSVVRACTMVIIVQLSFIFYKKPDLISTISFSLLITLIENPFKIQNLGLQLSYLRNDWNYNILS